MRRTISITSLVNANGESKTIIGNFNIVSEKRKGWNVASTILNTYEMDEATFVEHAKLIEE